MVESKEKIAVFDELGGLLCCEITRNYIFELFNAPFLYNYVLDVWTEAKPQKKSKKKARKDN